MIRFFCVLVTFIAFTISVYSNPPSYSSGGGSVVPLSTPIPTTTSYSYQCQGYNFDKGYWWQNDKAFIRGVEPYFSYDCYGCCQQHYRYTFTEVPVLTKTITNTVVKEKIVEKKVYPQQSTIEPKSTVKPKTDYGSQGSYKKSDIKPKADSKFGTLSYRDPEWKTKLLGIVKYRDEVEAKLRQSAIQQQEFLQTVQSLGLSGNFRMQEYGQNPYSNSAFLPSAFNQFGNLNALGLGKNQNYQYPASNAGIAQKPTYNVGYGYGQPQQVLQTQQPYNSGYASYTLGTNAPSFQLGAHGVQGNSVYGYSFSTLADIYGDTDLTALFQQVGQLAQNGQNIAAKGVEDFSTLVGQEGQNRKAIAEILAKSQAASQLMNSLKPTPETKFQLKGTQFQVVPGSSGSLQIQSVPGGGGNVPVMPKVGGNGNGQGGVQQLSVNDASKQILVKIITQRCGECHLGGAKKGGLDLTNYFAFNIQQKRNVIARISSTDAQTIMPPPTAGPALSAQEIALFCTCN